MIKLILTFFLSLLIGLVAFAPANKIVPRVFPDSLGVQLYEISGSILSGRVGQVRRQSTSIDNVAWKLKPGSLLLGSIAADVEVSLQSRDIQQDNSWLTGRVSRSLFSNSVTLSDIEAVSALAALQGPLKLPFLPVTGLLYVQLHELQLEDNKPVAAEGLVEFRSARWMIGKPADLGDFSAAIETKDDWIQASVTDLESGKVAVDGLAQLGPNSDWSVSGKLKPKADTPTPVANAMKALGRTDQQGWYLIDRKGRLPNS